MWCDSLNDKSSGLRRSIIAHISFTSAQFWSVFAVCHQCRIKVFHEFQFFIAVHNSSYPWPNQNRLHSTFTSSDFQQHRTPRHLKTLRSYYQWVYHCHHLKQTFFKSLLFVRTYALIFTFLTQSDVSTSQPLYKISLLSQERRYLL